MSRRHRDKKREAQAKQIRKRRLHEATLAQSKGYATLGGPIGSDLVCSLNLLVANPSDLNRHEQVVAVVDTGATTSTIHAEIVARLGLPVIHRVTVHHYDGEREANVVLASITLVDKNGNGARGEQPLVVATDMSVPMLFGMRSMLGGVLTVDLVKQEWTWRLHRVKQ